MKCDRCDFECDSVRLLEIHCSYTHGQEEIEKIKRYVDEQKDRRLEEKRRDEKRT